MSTIRLFVKDTARVSRWITGLAMVFVWTAVAGVSPARANSFTFDFTGSNQGASVDGTAVITVTSSGQLQIVLTNNISDIRSVGQAISGFSFSVVDSAGSYVDIDPVTMVAQQGQLISFSGSQTGTLLSATDPGWGMTGLTSYANALGFTGPLGTQAPDGLILGAPTSMDTSTATYSNANSSIIGSAKKNPHSPLVVSSLTLTLGLGSPLPATGYEFTDVTMYFGTNGAPIRTPEPGTLLLLCTGLVGLGAARRRLRP